MGRSQYLTARPSYFSTAHEAQECSAIQQPHWPSSLPRTRTLTWSCRLQRVFSSGFEWYLARAPPGKGDNLREKLGARPCLLLSDPRDLTCITGTRGFPLRPNWQRAVWY